MVQIVEMTHDEKVRMYNKLSKREIIEMLIECNRIISAMPTTVYTLPQTTNAPDPRRGWYITSNNPFYKKIGDDNGI